MLQLHSEKQIINFLTEPEKISSNLEFSFPLSKWWPEHRRGNFDLHHQKNNTEKMTEKICCGIEILQCRHIVLRCRPRAIPNRYETHWSFPKQFFFALSHIFFFNLTHNISYISVLTVCLALSIFFYQSVDPNTSILCLFLPINKMKPVNAIFFLWTILLGKIKCSETWNDR